MPVGGFLMMGLFVPPGDTEKFLGTFPFGGPFPFIKPFLGPAFLLPGVFTNVFLGNGPLVGLGTCPAIGTVFRLPVPLVAPFASDRKSTVGSCDS